MYILVISVFLSVTVLSLWCVAYINLLVIYIGCCVMVMVASLMSFMFFKIVDLFNCKKIDRYYWNCPCGSKNTVSKWISM